MKRISFLTILIFIAGMIISCGNTSSSDTITGYTDPSDWTGKTPSSADKSYNLTMDTGGIKSASGIGTHAVIYQGTLNGVDYAGIAIDNFDSSTPTSRFKLQIYWKASTIASTVSLLSTEYTVNLLVNGVQHTTPTGPLDLTITPNDDAAGIQSNTYSIEITNPIALTSNKITGSGIPDIRAQKY